MPVVKSAVHLKIENSQITERTWGLLITKQDAENFSIPVNEACTLIPEQKTLQHHLINSEMGKEKRRKNIQSDNKRNRQNKTETKR